MIDIVYNYGIKELFNVGKEELAKIKSDLTFNNPNYESVLRFSKWDRTKVPKFLKYYIESKTEDKEPFIVVPSGYKVPFPSRVVYDDRNSIEGEVNLYPLFVPTLREIQEKAVKNFLKTSELGQEMGYMGTLVLPTGSGKTVCGLRIAHDLNQKALIVVNKDDLVDGWMQDAKFCFGGMFEVGLVKGKKFDLKTVTITTIQTLSRLGKEKLDKLILRLGVTYVDDIENDLSLLEELQ